MKRLRKHPLVEVLARNGGNPRTLVLIEPLWGIPYNLIAPFATLYMYTQGITDVQIGTILSVSMAGSGRGGLTRGFTMLTRFTIG